MLTPAVVILFTLGYLLLLFGLAWWGEHQAAQANNGQAGRKSIGRLVHSPYTYALSLAVYCTAWTYYGSVGNAAQNGIEFLAIYLGPTLMVPLWYVLLRKIIRISKVQRLSSIADLISARYGKNSTLGSLVTVFCVLGVVPYISIQLKAISSSFSILSGQAQQVGNPVQLAIWQDSAFYLALGLIGFVIFFGTRKLDTSEQHPGMVTAIAFESMVKLVAFLAIGLYVTYGMFNGFTDIFAQANAQPALQKLFTLPEGPTWKSRWFWMLSIAAWAILFLPRQFQVAVVENTQEKHIKRAMWLLPLYLLIINLFVLPIALGGQLLLGNQPAIDADTYVLALPLLAGHEWMALLAYIGGFSAASSMIIVSTIALSTMISNNLVTPLVLGWPALKKRINNWTAMLQYSRRFSIAAIILLAYGYFRFVANYYPLVSIGLISFAAVAQFAPAVLGGLFWKEGHKNGALAGIVAGFVLWFFTLVLPTIIGAGLVPQSIMDQGLWGISQLRPYSLLGLKGLDPLVHSLVWSLCANAFTYVIFSLLANSTPKEYNQAAVFTDIFAYSTVYENAIGWKGTAYITDLRNLMVQFLGSKKAESLLAQYAKRFPDQPINVQQGIKASPSLVTFAEQQLAGVLGSASSRILVSSIAKEEPITLEEVYDILRESQQLMRVNQQLRRTSLELKKATQSLQEANNQLRKLDKEKDEFISTVTHEMRTPLTSIKAFTEILFYTDDLEDEERKRFLQTIINEADRMNRLIGQVLDLERFESGRQKLNLKPLELAPIIEEALQNTEQLWQGKQINCQAHVQTQMPKVLADQDRILQVLLNLISNAIKYVPEQTGQIDISAYYVDEQVKVHVKDNGKGIDPDSLPHIFEKFFQAKNQTTKKPKGSGLGLAICKQIIESHGGQIYAESQPGKGTRLSFTLPTLLNIGTPAAYEAHTYS